MKSFSSVDAKSLKGEFRILAERWGDRTRLTRREVTKPFHLAKPYWTGNVLLVQAANTTPGVFAGDNLTLEVCVSSGAAVLFTTTSATRIYTMAQGEALVDQRFHVASGGWLEVRPEMLIPQRGCRYRQRTRIECEAEAMIFYWESLAPGRVAHGERCLFSEISLDLEICYAGLRLVREVIRLDPKSEYFDMLHRPFEAAYFATGYLLWPNAKALEPLQQLIHGWNNDSQWLGCSCMDDRCWGFRAITRDALALRHLALRLRTTLASIVPYLGEGDRKL